MALLLGLGVVVAVLAAPSPVHRPAAQAAAWDALDPPARCASALELVDYPLRWPMVCRWRSSDDTEAGVAFPPPVGPPPWDSPRIEVYVARPDTRAQVAHAIAHELGHMHHTREADFAGAWLVARNLPADTPSTVWVEDYAEAFAHVFGPADAGWYAPTPRPSPSALMALKDGFFAA
jgi:hypothetical protein